MVEHDFGKGKALLLNFVITNYLDLKEQEWSSQACRAAETAPAIAAFFQALFRTMPLVRPLTIEPSLPQLQTYYYEDGDKLYVGLMRDYPGPFRDYAALTEPPPFEKKIVVRLTRPGFVYDLRAGRFLGHTDRPELYLRTGIAQVLAILPYEVQDLELDVPAAVRQGESIRLKARLLATNTPGKHVLRAELLDPMGKVIRHYSKNHSCPKGELDAHIQLALNEMPGQYVLRIKDIATGRVVEKNIIIRERYQQ
jgi:hypothetical protein